MADIKPMIMGIISTLIIGSIFILAPFIGFFEKILLATLAIVIGGIVASFNTHGTSIDGGVHGSISGIIGGAILGALFFTRMDGSILLSVFAGLFTGGFLFGFNFGIIGAVIGNLIKKYQKNKKFRGYLVCDKCGAYYQLQEDESPEDFSTDCHCGGQLHLKKSMQTPTKYTIDKRILGVGATMSIIGALLLTAVFQFHFEALLKFSFVMLAVGLWIVCISLFNLF